MGAVREKREERKEENIPNLAKVDNVITKPVELNTEKNIVNANVPKPFARLINKTNLYRNNKLMKNKSMNFSSNRRLNVSCSTCSYNVIQCDDVISFNAFLCSEVNI